MEARPYEERIGVAMLKKGLKLMIAESCTGGLIGHRITNIPGASNYYLGSITAYAYETKEQLLQVRHTTLQQHGAVSRPTVLEMAEGVRKVLAGHYPIESTIGLAVTGIAGPGGATPTKPVGLVFIALSTPGGAHVWEFHFTGSRLDVKESATTAALKLLWEYLEDKDDEAVPS
ncbi:MAG: CinA family protein [Anaerolineae bacterium]|nr:CinA family protein [Anaerolineae bacterium]